MSTMMSPFGLPEKRLIPVTTTAATSSGTTGSSSESTIMLQEYSDVNAARLPFDGTNSHHHYHHQSLPTLTSINTSSYLNNNSDNSSATSVAARVWDQQTSQYSHHLQHQHQRQQQQQQQLQLQQTQQQPQHVPNTQSMSNTVCGLIKKENRSEIIHSGHFMVSQIDDQQDEVSEDAEDASKYKELTETPVVPIGNVAVRQPEIVTKSAYPITQSSSTIAPRRFIDDGLSKLFECMSLAYSGSITSPKWKTFKGLPLKLKDKIRLNNIIWRAWHIQYIIGRDPYVCQFSSPADNDMHSKAEAIVLEGKYWKRRQTTVIAEYHKWRSYHKNKIRPRPTRHSFSGYHDGRWNDFFSNQDLNNLSVDDDFAMDFSDNLFNSLVPPNVIDFPNPREIARSGMGADFIQPGLTQLQPCLDDFMEPLSDFLLSRVCIMPPLFEESTIDNARESLKMNDKPSRFGGSPSLSSDYMQMSYSDMLDVSEAGSGTNIETANGKNFNTGNSGSANLVTNATPSPSAGTIQITNLAQQGIPHNSPAQQTSSQSVNVVPASISSASNINQVSNGSTALEISAMSSIDSARLHVQNNIILPGNVSYSTQSSSDLAAVATGEVVAGATASSGSIKLQHSRSYEGYDCVMDMSTMSNDYNQRNLVKTDSSQVAIIRVADGSTESTGSSSQASIAEHFVYPKMPTRIARHRSRSATALPNTFKPPQCHPLLQQQQQKCPQQTPGISTPQITQNQEVLSLNGINQQQSKGMERSISLPVYSQRRNAIGPLLNAQMMQQSQSNFASSNLAAIRGNPYAPSNNSNSFSNNTLPGASNSTPSTPTTPLSSDLSSPHLSGPYSPDSHINVNAISANTAGQQTSDYPTDSNSLIAQLLSSSGTAMNSNFSSIKNSNNSYEKTGIETHQSLGMYSSHPSLHMLSYPSSSSMSPGLLSSESGSGGGPTRTLRGRLSGRLSDPEPPRGLYATSIASGSSKPVRKISSPAVSPPPLMGSAYSPSGSKDSNSSTPVASPQSSLAPVGSPSLPSSIKTLKLKSDTDKLKYKEHRRVCHINAEQKRRCNIKNGFDTLRTLLPSINQNANTKISKAAMLQKAAEYIRNMKSERQQRQEECENLRQQIENLNQTIGVFQSQLPATGAPISCQRAGQAKERFDSYVKDRTITNWKFWIFGLVMESLLASYMATVTTNDIDDMCRSVLRWLDQNCSLVTLRREVLNSLRHLSTSTNILTSPATLREEILEAVSKKAKRLNN